MGRTKAETRWTRNAADERAVAEGCRFDERSAERVSEFFRRFLRHSKGEWGGKPFELLEWQYLEVIAPLFGWRLPDGRRRFRKAYIEIPKKNGKSTLAAGVGLYLLVGDGEQGAEVYSVAADRDQARIVHGEAIRMVESSPELRSRLTLNRSTHQVSFTQTKSWYKALSSEANTKEGLNAHGLILDELHAWSGRGLYDALKYAGRSRRQPLMFQITTAGDDPHSICREQHDYARGVLKGDIQDTRYFAYIRAARQRSEGDDTDDEWTDPETWQRANPSLGVTMRLDDFAADVKEAEKSPTTIAAFKRYSLNIWATAESPWLSSHAWSLCRADITADSLLGRTCWGGLDLSKTQDMTAFALAFRMEDLDCWSFLAWFWLPEARLQDPNCPPHFRLWAEQGFLRTTPGSVCDYRFVIEEIRAIASRYDLREFAYDPWNAEATTQELEDVHGIKRIAFPQTVSNYAEPTKEFERLVMSRKLMHDGNPILAWQAGHVQVRTDPSGNIRPVKPSQHDPRKIDGIVACVMALARGLLQAGNTASVYDSREIEFL